MVFQCFYNLKATIKNKDIPHINVWNDIRQIAVSVECHRLSDKTEYLYKIKMI